MIFGRSRQSNRPIKLGFALVTSLLSALVLYFSEEQPLQASPAAAKKSDMELSQALIGTWELQGKDLPRLLRKGFARFDPQGIFKVLAIVDILGSQARVEAKGRWSIKNGFLITNFTKSSIPVAGVVGMVGKNKVVSIEDGVFVSLSEKGEKEEMQIGRIPAQLPRLLSPRELEELHRLWLKEIAVSTPQPEYPIDARQRRIEGSGKFKLLLSKTGDVSSIQILKSTGDSRLDDAATKALRTWRFKVGALKEVIVPISFVIRGAR